ncbi:outer membrane protein ImpK/VasF OmpA/MotB domain [Vibrio astriarenae]|nr:outer membrane protein ImpK/VasF OmpA/MotB domain [Vibrio sp. C7]
MNDLLDEVTVPLMSQPAMGKSRSVAGTRLTSLNAIKNQARYNLAQRKSTLFDNEILNVSAELFSLIVSVKRLECPTDMYAFRQGLKGMLTDLKYKVAKLDYPPSVADKSCFLFAVMIDEQILHSSWGDESGWENQTLVSELFGVKNGGEQFYLVAERALLQPILLKDLLELIYIMIKLGFRGRYRVDGKELLGVLVQRLEEAVFADQPAKSEDGQTQLSRPVPATLKRVRRPQRPVRLWTGLLASLVLFGICWGGAFYWSNLTVSDKAEPFANLSDFTEKYYSSANIQEKEYIYMSTPEDLQGVKLRSSSSSSSSDAGLWRVQLATLNSKASAQQFLSDHGAMLPNAEVSREGRFFVVTSALSTADEAQEVIETARKAGIDDAFVIRVKQ